MTLLDDDRRRRAHRLRRRNGARIFCVADGGKLYSVRLRDLVRRGDITANVDMRPGDILIIPQSWF
jgi:polysaccharide export outer membrane protein